MRWTTYHHTEKKISFQSTRARDASLITTASQNRKIIKKELQQKIGQRREKIKRFNPTVDLFFYLLLECLRSHRERNVLFGVVLDSLIY